MKNEKSAPRAKDKKRKQVINENSWDSLGVRGKT